MGGLGRKRSSGTQNPKPGTTPDPGNPVAKPGTEFADDNVQRMPVLDSVTAVRAAQRLARQLSGRSGRGSTRLVSDSGTRPYVASLLGSTL